MRLDGWKRGVAAACLALHAGLALAQGAGIERAQEAYEQERYEECLSLLAGAERGVGRNPRIESIRARALAELGRTKEAYASALAYQAMTRQLSDGGPAHSDMLQLVQELRSKLEAEKKEARAKLDRERDEEAARFVRQRESATESKVMSLRQKQADSILKARAASGDAKEFDTALRSQLGTQAGTVMKQVQQQSTRRSGDLYAEIGALLTRQPGQDWQRPPVAMENARLAAQPPYKLLHFKLDDKTLELRLRGGSDRGTLEEVTRVQGFDLARLQPDGFEVANEDGGRVLRFRFRQADLWASGTAKYEDGRLYQGDTDAMRGSRTLALFVPEPVADDVVTAFQELMRLRRP